MRLLIPVLIVAVIALAVVVIVALRSRVERARQSRQRCGDVRPHVDVSAPAVDPTSAALAVEIAQHLANSKEIR